ncbi:MAG: CHAT domain-containing protein, partial [Leptolyngbyaceae cyanobacterium]
VYDEAAATMMTEFYQQLAEFPTISRAQPLQRAQMKLREHPDFKHPSYWSPYIMVGNWL